MGPQLVLVTSPSGKTTLIRLVSPQRAQENTRNDNQKGTSPIDDLLKTLIVQNQQRMDTESKRAETFQNSLLAIMASNNSPIVSIQEVYRYIGSDKKKTSARRVSLDDFVILEMIV